MLVKTFPALAEQRRCALAKISEQKKREIIASGVGFSTSYKLQSDKHVDSVYVNTLTARRGRQKFCTAALKK